MLPRGVGIIKLGLMVIAAIKLLRELANPILKLKVETEKEMRLCK